MPREKVNFIKSISIFSKNMLNCMCQNICHELNAVKENENAKFVGMPIMVGAKKKVVFE